MELSWLEREFYSTNKTKFDGIISKIVNKSIALGSVEFSGGVNDSTPPLKYAKDIGKLYSNMVRAMEDANTNQMFCMCCYRYHIYFEKLGKVDGVLYRTIDAKMEIPTTPKKLISYIKQIPMILTWKQALINHAINLN